MPAKANLALVFSVDGGEGGVLCLSSKTKAFGYFARYTNVCFTSFKNIFLLIFSYFHTVCFDHTVLGVSDFFFSC